MPCDANAIGWLSLRSGAVNKGNSVIEDSTWQLLARPSRFEVSIFSPLSAQQIAEINLLPGLVLPGATLLDATEHPLAMSLTRIQCQKLAVGVAFCTQTPQRCSLELAAAIGQPVGSRDPFTHDLLRSAGIESDFVGCSTLHMGTAESWISRPGPVVFSLGRGDQLPLQQCVHEAAKYYDVTVVNHVPDRQRRFDCQSPVGWIDLQDADQLEQIYLRASVVVTGRIHGALPALAVGVPTIFFGRYRDSRCSIIDYLGLEQLPPVPELLLRRIRCIRKRGMGDLQPLDRAAGLRARMRAFLNRYWFN